jgi:Glucodextranase, domain B
MKKTSLQPTDGEQFNKGTFQSEQTTIGDNMKNIRKTSVQFFFALTLVAAALVTFQLQGTDAQAQSSYFTSQGCSGCHSAPVVATCNGCHAHGTHPSSAKSSINVAGATNKTSYAPGETVTVTITGGYRTGWFRAVLYDQNTVELARSTGNDSGMGSSATYPATLSAPAPTTPGTYVWKVGWYGNQYDSGTYGSGWTPDPNNSGHGTEIVSANSFTVASAIDTTAPVIGVFTLPATATSLTVPVSSLTATDNVAVTGYLITTSATPPAASAAGWTASAPTSVTAVAGSNTFYAWAKDAAGNVSAVKSATVVVSLPDTIAPVVTFTLPATATSLTVAVSSLSATDNVAVTGYLITTSATPPAASAAGWSASAPTSVTAVAGSNTFYAWAKDAAGNVSAVKSATVVVSLPDTIAPVVGTFTLPATATNLTILVSSFTATDNVAVTGYLITTSATAPAASASGWTTTAPASVTAVVGINTYYAWAKDAAGNVSLSKSASVTVTLPDTIAPVVGAFTLPATATSLTVSVSSFTATDNVAVTGYLITTTAAAPTASAAGWSATAPTSVTAAAAGSVTFYAWAKDAVGNISAAKSASVVITTTTTDTTPPTLTISSLANGAFTNKVTLNVTGNASDASGIKSVTVNDQVVTVNPDGSFSYALTLTVGANTITTIATDNAGNQQVDTRTVTYDPNAPVLTVSAPADNSTTIQSFITVTGTISESSTVTISVNNGSPQSAAITGNSFSSTVNLAPGVNTIDIIATDPAGNSATAKRTVTYDNSNTSLTLAVIYPSQDITTRSSSLTLKGTVVDASSNVKVSITIDGKTYTPEVDHGAFHQRLTFTKAKLYAITVTATDDAGNSSSIVRNVIYRPSSDDNHHDD